MDHRFTLYGKHNWATPCENMLRAYADSKRPGQPANWIIALRKHAYSNILKRLPQKTKIFR